MHVLLTDRPPASAPAHPPPRRTPHVERETRKNKRWDVLGRGMLPRRARRHLPACALPRDVRSAPGRVTTDVGSASKGTCRRRAVDEASPRHPCAHTPTARNPRVPTPRPHSRLRVARTRGRADGAMHRSIDAASQRSAESAHGSSAICLEDGKARRACGDCVRVRVFQLSEVHGRCAGAASMTQEDVKNISRGSCWAVSAGPGGARPWYVVSCGPRTCADQRP